MTDRRPKRAVLPRWSMRRALVSDAASLVAVKAAASGAAGALPHAHTRASAEESRFLEDLLGQHGGFAYVAEARGAIAGYLALQQAAHPAVAARHAIQLCQLYVLPPFHGTGVAAQLMSAGLEHARADQHDVIWLGVSEENLRAIAFYRKQGFEAVGVHPVGSEGHTHRDVVMSRPMR